MTKKIILHLCADLGSDSYFYQLNKDEYEVVLIGKDIGVENFHTDKEIYGIIANPVCTELSTAKGFHKENDIDTGMFLVNHCIRIIKDTKPKFWILENPFNGRLKQVIGPPDYVYQPWEFGSPWTKKTAIWGNFNKPTPIYKKWEDVPKNPKLYTRPGRNKPSLAFMHKSALKDIEEFTPFKDKIINDADFRSLCSQGFAKAIYDSNR
jgi:hypothetical protein